MRAATVMNASFFNGHARNGSRGFSMVELMVAMVVGLFLIGAMLTVVLSSSATGRTRERTSDMQNNGRYAISFMRRDVQHAGFNGYTSVLNPDAPVSFAVTNVCDSATVGMLSLRVWAKNNDNPYNGKCIDSDLYVNGTDVLVVRHLSPAPVTAFNANEIYFRSAYEGGEAFLGSAPPDFSKKLWTDPLDYKIEESVYYISKCTGPYVAGKCPASENPRIPALYRVKLGAGPAMTPELVASGIENLQIRVRQTNSTSPIVGESKASYANPDSILPDGWADVTAVEVSLLARGTLAEPGYKNKDTVYVLGDQQVTAPDDGFRRQIFTTVVLLRNN